LNVVLAIYFLQVSLKKNRNRLTGGGGMYTIRRGKYKGFKLTKVSSNNTSNKIFTSKLGPVNKRLYEMTLNGLFCTLRVRSAGLYKGEFCIEKDGKNHSFYVPILVKSKPRNTTKMPLASNYDNEVEFEELLSELESNVSDYSDTETPHCGSSIPVIDEDTHEIFTNDKRASFYLAGSVTSHSRDTNKCDLSPTHTKMQMNTGMKTVEPGAISDEELSPSTNCDENPVTAKVFESILTVSSSKMNMPTDFCDKRACGGSHSNLEPKQLKKNVPITTCTDTAEDEEIDIIN